MKKLLLLVTLTLAMSLLMSSCSDDTSTGPSEPALGEFIAKIDGKDWKVSDAVYNNDEFTIIASQSGTMETIENSISIHFDGIANEEAPIVKTYTTSNIYLEFKEIDKKLVYLSWNSVSSTTNVTSVTSTAIKGTFSFTATNGKDQTTKVISGSFNVPRK